MKLISIAMLMLSMVAASTYSSRLTANSQMPVDVEGASSHIKTLVLGSGCFWGPEKRYENIKGVLDAESGYADGKGFYPSYREITKPSRRFDPNNYAEVVKVTYNANLISTERLLQQYFESHDPTQKNRQGNDVGSQYRSIVLYTDEQQKQTAERTKAQFQTLLTAAGYGAITTAIKPLRKFYPAEEYHQNYLAKNPNGYCPDHSTGVTFAPVATTEVDNRALLTGKHIVIIDAKNYCPYCEKLKTQVLNDYQGDIPLHYRYADQLQHLSITTATWATPTILFLENGEEVAGFQGFMDRESFYQALGAFKLGQSEAYEIAFQKGTERPFCQQYDIFKNTPDGVFVDKLSGKPLFDTQDRFNSGTGWLSFTQPVAGSVTYHRDLSHGMVRTEIRSKSSGIHLGHVFENEGPNRRDRYCINAQVLEFKPRDK